jgi:hypothetical protein
MSLWDFRATSVPLISIYQIPLIYEIPLIPWKNRKRKRKKREGRCKRKRKNESSLSCSEHYGIPFSFFES